MNLLEEFRSVVTALNESAIPYAVCGGMAMAVYGHARATQDIDILVTSASLEDALAILNRLGYQEASRLAIGHGQIRMIRAIKTSGTEHLMVDILEAPDAGEEAWTNRRQIDTDFGQVWFASK
ncbi:MAG: nucleotidyl transferase AbiEii/AbiGii toxin family protein, partial [Spirochaetota bacterium]